MIPWILFVLVAGLLGYIFLTMPKSGWVRWKAKRSKSGVIVTLCSADGFEEDRFMKADLDNGVFTTIKGEEAYVFTPNPKFATGDLNGESGQLAGSRVQSQNSIDVSTEEQKIIDEAILHRSFSDTGKAHYTGLVTKGIAVTPKFLKLVKHLNDNVDEKKIYHIDLVDPQKLQNYFKGTFNMGMIRNITFAAEQRGFLRRPMQDFLGKNKFTIVFLLIIVLGGYMILSGKIDLGRIFGKYM